MKPLKNRSHRAALGFGILTTLALGSLALAQDGWRAGGTMLAEKPAVMKPASDQEGEPPWQSPQWKNTDRRASEPRREKASTRARERMRLADSPRVSPPRDDNPLKFFARPASATTTARPARGNDRAYPYQGDDYDPAPRRPATMEMALRRHSARFASNESAKLASEETANPTPADGPEEITPESSVRSRRMGPMHEGPMDGPTFEYGESGDFGPDDDGDHDDCGPDCTGGHWRDCWAHGCYGPLFENLSILGGVHGFKGPVDQGQNGNFGLHESFNLSIPVSFCLNIGGQFGMNFVHSDYSGAGGTLGNDSREQMFMTTGLYRRTDCGLQGGVVFDWLHDDFYVNMNVHQLRSELSWANGWGDWGFMGAFSSRDDATVRTDAVTQQPVNERWEPTDQYALFIRKRMPNCGECRVFGGFTGEKDGLAGVDALLPMSDLIAVSAAATYLIPEESTGAGGVSGESWNLSLNLIWYPGGRARCEGQSPLRPLFNPADNGSFFVDRFVE